MIQPAKINVGSRSYSCLCRMQRDGFGLQWLEILRLGIDD